MKRVFTILALLASAGALQACSTTYGKMGLTGGVEAVAVTNDTYRISARGNGYTDATTIQDYALLKASETTLAAGHTHFVALSGRDATARSTYQSSGTMSSNVIGNSIFTTYSPGQSYNIVAPGEDLMIRVFTPRKGEALPPNAFPAQEVYNNVNPRVKRSK